MARVTLKVRPVVVPWTVDPATPYVQLGVADGEMPHLTLVAWFPHPRDAADGGAYQKIRLDFRAPGGFVRFAPTPHHVALDYSGLVLVPSLQMPRDEYARRVIAEIEATGGHPFPELYTVEDSPWLAELGLTTLNHYILLGDDTVWEIVAAGVEWSRLAALPHI